MGAWVAAVSRHRNLFSYGLSGLIVLVSILTWYNFNLPPINSNIGFDLFPWRQVGLATSPFNPYIWPGSYVPWAVGTPLVAYYGVFFSASSGSYSIALFAGLTLIDVLGGLCLLYLIRIWLLRIGIQPEYALLGVIIYSFNGYKLLNGFGVTDGYYSNGLLTSGDPAILVILAFLTFLTLFRSRYYVLLLGPFSFVALSNFPTATLVLTQEYILVLLVLLGYRWVSLPKLALLARLLRTFKEGAIILSTIFLANAYLVYPLVLTLKLYSSDLSSSSPSFTFSYVFDNHQTLFNSLRLITDWAIFTDKSPPWAVQYMASPVATLLSLVVPFLALAAGLWIRRLSELVLYAMMLVVGCLSASTNSPLGPAFIFLTSNVAPFRAFYYGAVFSPVLLICYCFFAVPTIAYVIRLTSRLLFRTYSSTRLRAKTSPRLPVRRAVANEAGFGVSLVLSCLIGAVIVSSTYPALSPAFSQAHSADFPIGTVLPPYYPQASTFLQSTDPNGPTMVFPEVEPFDSNAVNGTTWYSGVNLYPNLIANPSISSAYPNNYLGQFGSDLPPAGLVYDLGGSICPNLDCLKQAVSPIPSAANLYSTHSSEFATNDSKTIDWNASFPTDSVSITNSSGLTSIHFKVNSSIAESNGHWFIGFFPKPLNLSAYTSAVVNFSLSGVSSYSVFFGFHSFTSYGPGNGYALGNYTLLRSGVSESVLIPLPSPSTDTGGNLDNVTNLFFVDKSPVASQSVYLNVTSVRLVTVPTYVAQTWKAGTGSEQLELSEGILGTNVSLRIDRSVLEPNGQWGLGYFDPRANLSDFDFVILNYTLTNVDLQYLFFGFHSGGEYSQGSGFPLPDYFTFNDSGNYESMIPLDAPTILDGGSLANVTNVFVKYDPPISESGIGYVNVSSLELGRSNSDDAAFLASDLARLGVEFAYVDTSIAYSTYPTYVGNFYNGVFANSTDFSQVFHLGTVTIYRDRLYSGPIASPPKVQPLSQADASVGDLTASLSNVYYNDTNLGIAYVPRSLQPTSWNVTAANITNVSRSSVTEYSAQVSAATQAIVELNTQFSNGWVAKFTNGTEVRLHFEVDGFANGWLLPHGTYEVIFTFNGADLFAYVEVTSFAIPPALIAAFLVTWVRKRRRPRVRA